jgi:hypothetical protein
MNIGLLCIRRFLSTIPNFQSPSLVIRAIGARNQFLILSLEWKPRFKVILLRRCVVQSPGHDGNYLEGKSKRLVEFL